MESAIQQDPKIFDFYSISIPLDMLEIQVVQSQNSPNQNSHEQLLLLYYFLWGCTYPSRFRYISKHQPDYFKSTFVKSDFMSTFLISLVGARNMGGFLKMINVELV